MRIRADHAYPRDPAAGFTMVELIVVMILIGILGAIGAARFFVRTGFDAASYAEQVRGMARYAQKLAIAQNRNVYVVGILNASGVGAIGLCYANSTPCPANQLVTAPGGSNSGNVATRANCVTGGAYSASWYCEGVPSGVSVVPVSGSFSTFYFSGLGKPYLPGDSAGAAGSGNPNSSYATTVFDFTGDGVTIPVTIYQETGYVN